MYRSASFRRRPGAVPPGRGFRCRSTPGYSYARRSSLPVLTDAIRRLCGHGCPGRGSPVVGRDGPRPDGIVTASGLTALCGWRKVYRGASFRRRTGRVPPGRGFRCRSTPGYSYARKSSLPVLTDAIRRLCGHGCPGQGSLVVVGGKCTVARLSDAVLVQYRRTGGFAVA